MLFSSTSLCAYASLSFSKRTSSSIFFLSFSPFTALSCFNFSLACPVLSCFFSAEKKRSTNQTSLIFNSSLEPYFYHIFSVLKCTQIMRDLGYSFSTSLSLRVAKNVQTRQCGLDRCKERCTTAGCGQLKLCTVLAQPGPCWLAREALEMSRHCSALGSAPQL